MEFCWLRTNFCFEVPRATAHDYKIMGQRKMCSRSSCRRAHTSFWLKVKLLNTFWSDASESAFLVGSLQGEIFVPYAFCGVSVLCVHCVVSFRMTCSLPMPQSVFTEYLIFWHFDTPHIRSKPRTVTS